jgi:uncharacterized protein YbjT (DUF2867 family)
MAMTGVAAVISTAAGYTRNDRNAEAIDTFGNANLATAANLAGVPRFVLISILTCDQALQVPHFRNKKLAEDKFEELGVPFIALRPGAFFDMVAKASGDPFGKGLLIWLGSRTAPLSFVLSSDLAGYLADAVDADIAVGERMDIGWSRPLSILGAAQLVSRHANRNVRVVSMPTGLLGIAGKLSSPFAPLVGDMAAMAEWFDTGRYVADTSRQARLFGPVPAPEDAIGRLAASLGH